MDASKTIAFETTGGVVALTIVGFPQCRATPEPAALVIGYLEHNPLAPTITCTASEARRLAQFIIAAAENAERVVAELKK